ncbi:hypothetical protein [Nocardioides sp. B-3]|uniref:hypothetical protein n=1 Tax=Nocardioides sp. B-3 TaxID=2895565 RepID=UPI0021528AEE|nr:hypothetical protein [Nocardioides sp. B-3]UUZ59482.1 hypothetical protein LP418_27525 [Nocardioides sp. B-3]
MSVVLAVGLDRLCHDVLTETIDERSEPVTVVTCSDARTARNWLGERGSETPVMIIAAFREHEAWSLSALFTRLRSRALGDRTELVLVSELPAVALPVLITDVSGLHTVLSGSGMELRHHLNQTFPDQLAASAS